MKFSSVLRYAFAVVTIAAGAVSAQESQTIPNTGQVITPTAPNSSRFEQLNPDLADFTEYTAGQAAISVVGPDKKSLLILTSGYNRLYSPSTGARIAARA